MSAETMVISKLINTNNKYYYYLFILLKHQHITIMHVD